MDTAILTAADISFDHCKATIERELGALTGVRVVSVDVPTKRITVSFEPALVSGAEIIAKLDEEGYPATG